MLSVTFGFAVLIIVAMIATVTAVGKGFARAAATAASGTGSRRPAALRLVTPLLGGWLVLAVVLAATGFFVTGPSEAPRIGWALVPLALAGSAPAA
jgi:hypothetical protein